MTNTCQKETETMFEVKRSKFISFLIPYSKFSETINDLKKKHPKARHIIYAYRYINELNQVVENSTDDGEPKSAAGKPTLNVLRGADLVNAAIITVRYFGGIKLGIGGMIRAYSDSANFVVSQSPYIEKTKEIVIETHSVIFNQIKKFEHSVCAAKGSILKRDFTSYGANITVSIPKELAGTL